MQVYLPIAELPVDMLVILCMGAAVGFISGMFGVGGGFLMTPLLIFVGIPPAIAVATEAAQIAASSMTGSIAYWRRKALDVKLGCVLLAGGLLGTVLGVLFFNAMRRIGQLETVITLSYVMLLGGLGALMLAESLRAVVLASTGQRRAFRKGGKHGWYEHLPWKMHFHRSKLYISIIPILALASFIGFAGAVLGIGGGFILVPALIYVFRVPTAVVVGTSLFQILFTMIAATMLHATTNHSVDIVLAVLLIVGGVFGAQFGARAGANLRGEYFRLLLAVLVFGVGLRFAVDLFTRPPDVYGATETETFR
ncbi:MAG: sulfite exporter TauE/SafE family protein [Methylobacteriaceae bacterium]|nr:sulfite exporter TauE/SafE family protein [Methylobacteriaceae bacterium]